MTARAKILLELVIELDYDHEEEDIFNEELDEYDMRPWTAEEIAGDIEHKFVSSYADFKGWLNETDSELHVRRVEATIINARNI